MSTRITYFGHSSFEVNTKGKSIVFDPFISGNPLAKTIDTTKVNPDFLFLSHGHDDHIGDAITIAKQSKCKCIGSWETELWLKANGIDNTHSMNAGGKAAFDFGTLKITNAVHSSSFSSGHAGGNAIGCIVENEECCFYYSGDTALTMDMQLIPRRFELDFAFLPIGDNYTMDIEDAISAAQFIECSTIIGMHYNTFPVISLDKKQTINEFEMAGITLILPEIGETIEF